jgi:adhesin HecA-like repeat protein
MAVGSGLSATFGFASETTVGTPVAVTRFIEADTESIALKKHTVQGAGQRGGALVRRGQRRQVVAREAAGDITFDVPTNGFGLILQHMISGTAPTPTSIGGGLFQQIHNVGSLQGKSFTTQIIRPDTTGVLTQQAFTYPGCKVTGWELAVKQAGQLTAKVTVDALDEATPQNGFANTTLSSAASAAAATFSTVATIPVGSYVTLDTGLLRETVLTTNVSGAGPFVITIATPLAFAHATATPVGSATGVNYGAAVALQTASYTAGVNILDFSQGTLTAGGSTAVTSGKWTNTGGQVVANVRSVTLKGTNPLKVDRWGLGQQVRSEQLENNWRDYSIDVELDYNSRLFYDAYAADTPLTLQFSFAGRGGAQLSFYMPVGFQEDGATPQVASEDIIIQKLAFTILDDGVNGALQAVYVSTDAAV